MPAAALAGSGRVRGRAGGRARVSGRGVPRTQLGEMQRARLLAGAVCAIDEIGWEQATVAHITTRVRMSRRTFYALYANREECLAAVLNDVCASVTVELAQADLSGLGWRERVRTGLLTILSFLDREPVLARVCVVQALRAGGVVQERREEILVRLARVVDEGRLQGARGEGCTALTAEGLVGAAFAIVYARLAKGHRAPLTGLLGELMGMIVLPYLGPAAARRERGLPVPAAPRAVARQRATVACGGLTDPLEGVRMRLTYRTARVLEAVAELAGESPSNRVVANRAGIADPGQISKLLRRLEQLGLLLNTGEGGRVKGEPNAWSLTERGEAVVRSLGVSGRVESRAA
jgi:AcrR family transcriptional regulator